MKKFMKKLLKKTEGFTLVELIVVIAILGILAAVAVPAYTGYMEKAKEAGDTQVVSAVNTALFAALTENQLDTGDITDVDYDETNGTISVTLATANATLKAEVEDDFDSYFDGNSGALNYYDSLTFDTTAKVFKGVAP